MPPPLAHLQDGFLQVTQRSTSDPHNLSDRRELTGQAFAALAQRQFGDQAEPLAGLHLSADLHQNCRFCEDPNLSECEFPCTLLIQKGIELLCEVLVFIWMTSTIIDLRHDLTECVRLCLPASALLWSCVARSCVAQPRGASYGIPPTISTTSSLKCVMEPEYLPASERASGRVRRRNLPDVAPHVGGRPTLAFALQGRRPRFDILTTAGLP
jgi:hypothetical protein